MDPRRKRRAAVAAAMMIASLSFDAAVVVVVWHPAVRRQAPWKRTIVTAIWQEEERTMLTTQSLCIGIILGCYNITLLLWEDERE